MSFHRTQYGMFGNAFIADLSGQVGTTVEEVMGLNWPDRITQEQAEDIAATNGSTLAAAIDALNLWRQLGAR